jgi:hypothetical protein
MIRRLGIGCVVLVALALPSAASAKSSPSEVKNAAKQCKSLRSEMGRDAFREEYGANENGRNALGRCVSKHARLERRAEAKALRACKAEYTDDAAAFLEKYGTNEADASFERPPAPPQGDGPPKPPGDAPEGDRPSKPEGDGPSGDEPSRPNAELRKAMHKCVMLKLRAQRAERREALENAVDECKAELVADPAAFMEKYGADDTAEASNEEPGTEPAPKPGDGTGEPSGERPGLGRFVAFGRCVLSKVKASKAS